MASSSSQYSESFSTNKQLQKHLNKMRTIKCGLCSATFKERGALKAHQFTHGKTKQYECAVCSLKCRNPGDLKTHLKIHINDRQVKCKETSCKLLFITKGLMLSHWRATHLKMKIVKCSVCGHLSTSRSNLKVSCPFTIHLKPDGLTYSLNKNRSKMMHWFLLELQVTDPVPGQCIFCQTRSGRT